MPVRNANSLTRRADTSVRRPWMLTRSRIVGLTVALIGAVLLAVLLISLALR